MTRTIELPENVPSLLLNFMLIANELRAASKSPAAKRAFATAKALATIMLQGPTKAAQPMLGIDNINVPENLPRRLKTILDEYNQWANKVTK